MTHSLFFFILLASGHVISVGLYLDSVTISIPCHSQPYQAMLISPSFEGRLPGATPTIRDPDSYATSLTLKTTITLLYSQKSGTVP